MAANQFSASMGVMTPDQQIQLLDRSIEVMWSRMKNAPTALSEFFDTEDVDSLSFTISSVSNIVQIPIENSDTEKMPYKEPAPGRKRTFTLLNYRSAIRVTRTMIEADRFNKVTEMTTGLMPAALSKLEHLRADVFNSHGFSGTSGADSLPICDNSHPHENPEAGTWDNLGTGDLTGANMHALRLLLDRITDEIGDPMPTNSVTLLVTPEDRQKALELTRSTLTPEDSLDSENVLLPDIKVKVSHYLTDTDAYFMFGNLTGRARGLHEMYLSRPDLSDLGNNPTDIPIDKRVRFIVAMGHTISKNIAGSPGAA